jgi:hypothetical protein
LKKRTKKLFYVWFRAGASTRPPGDKGARAKVFCFFFSKNKSFLFPRIPGRPAQERKRRNHRARFLRHRLCRLLAEGLARAVLEHFYAKETTAPQFESDICSRSRDNAASHAKSGET